MPLDTQTLRRYRLERAEDSEIQLKNAKIFLDTVKIYLNKKEIKSEIGNKNHCNYCNTT